MPSKLLHIHEIYFTCLSGKLPTDNVWKRETPLKNTEGEWTNGNSSYWCSGQRDTSNAGDATADVYGFGIELFDLTGFGVTSSFVFLAICREALISDRNPQAWSAV